MLVSVESKFYIYMFKDYSLLTEVVAAATTIVHYRCYNAATQQYLHLPSGQNEMFIYCMNMRVSDDFSRGSPVFAPPTDWPVSYELK